MRQLFKLAWRNIWRKRRRSFIAIVSVAFAIIISVSLRSLMLGNYDKMVEAGVKTTGHLQVHAAGYWKDKSINDLVDYDSVIKRLSNPQDIIRIMPRLLTYALAAGDSTSKAVVVNGMLPRTENDFTNLSNRLVKGVFLTDTATGILLSEGLSKYLKLTVGDTVVLIGQGYHASIAAGKYQVEGIVKLANPQANLMNAYLSLPVAQEFASAPKLVSAVIIETETAQTKTLRKLLQSSLDTSYEVMTWDEMQPEIRNSQKIDTTIFTLLATCLYLIVGMGIIGTILMMALERRKEFGVLGAIGVQKGQIQTLIALEAALLAVIGIVLAFVIAVPFVLYMNAHPIPLTGDSGKSFEAMGAEPVLQLGVKPYLFALMAAIVFCIMMTATLFPFAFVQRLKISEAIK